MAIQPAAQRRSGASKKTRELTCCCPFYCHLRHTVTNRELGLQVCGLVVVEDMTDCPVMNAVRYARGLPKPQKQQLIQLFTDVLPIRFAAFYMINPPYSFKAALALARPFLTAKVRDRIQALSSITELELAGVSLAALPASLPPEEANRWVVAVQTEAQDGGRCTMGDIGG